MTLSRYNEHRRMEAERRRFVPHVPNLAHSGGLRLAHLAEVRLALEQRERVPFSEAPPVAPRLGFWDRVAQEFRALSLFEQRVVRVGVFVLVIALGMCVVLLVVA